MNKNITKTFLLITFVFLLVSLTAINATDANETSVEYNNQQITQTDTQTNSIIHNAEEQTIKSVNSKNITNKEISKTKQYTLKTNDKINTTLDIKFFKNNNDELSTENILITHIGEEFTIDITLTENEYNTPINSEIKLYLLDNTIPETIQLDTTGHAQKIYSIDKIGEDLTIYAEFEGNDQYLPQTSQTLIVDSEKYDTVITLNKIENTVMNSTINIEGLLYYKENIPIIESDINIFLNNNLITTVQTNNEGKYKYNHKLENISVQDMAQIKVEFISSDDKFESSINETYFDIEKISNTIQINEINSAIVSTQITIEANVIDENNQTYNGLMKIKIIDKNTRITYLNDSVILNNGHFITTFKPSKASTYQITLLIDETENYLQTYTTKEFNVEKATLYLNCDDFYEAIINQNISICGKIENENQDPMKNISIEISTDDNVLGITKTNEKGEFNFTEYIFMEIPDDDFFTIYFYIEENEDHDNIFEESSIYLSRRNVKFNLQCDDFVKINQTLHINGSIKDSYNDTIVPRGTISLFINSSPVSSNTPLTADGNFMTEINIGEKYIGEDILYLEALFVPENNKIYYEDSYAYKEINHEIIETKLQITSKDTTVEKTTNITIRLFTENNTNLNEVIGIKIQDIDKNELYNENHQLNDGTIILEYTPQKEGIYYIQAEYKGLEHIYTKSHDEIEISVNKTPTLITIDSPKKYYYVNDSIIIQGKLTNVFNESIKNSNIQLEIFNTTFSKQITTKTDDEGKYKTTFTPSIIAENLTVRVLFEETEKYYESISEKSFEIIKHNTTIELETLNLTIKSESTITISGKVIEKIDHSNANGNVTIKINDKTIETIELKNGKFTTEYTIQEVGNNNNLQVIFNENEAYNTSNTLVTFDVIPLKTQIKIDDIKDTFINNKVSIIGILTDENNNLINGELTVKINDELINENLKVETGIFTIEYTPQEAKKYNINISYTGDNLHYTSSTNNTTFNADKSRLKIKDIEERQTDENNTITISGTVTNEDNIDTSNIKVIVYLNNETIETVTDNNGKFNLTTEKLIPNDYKISIHIDETNKFNEYDENIEQITISKDTPKINLNEIPEATYNIPLQIEGNITDSYDRPLNNTSLIIKVEQKEYLTITDDKGKFEVTLNDFNAGKNNLQIIVSDSMYYNRVELNTDFTVKKQMSKILLNDVSKVIPGENFTLSGKLLDKNDNKISNKIVTIIVNNKKYNVVTNDEGDFSLSINRTKVGNYNANFTFIDENYEQGYNNTTVNVSKLNVKLMVSGIVSIVGEKITLRAILVDENEHLVNGGNLVFKINGRSLRIDDRFDTNIQGVHKFTVINGIVEYTITADLYLRHGKNITASYSGSSKYESAKSNVATVSIKLRNQNVEIETSQKTVKHHENIIFTAKITDITENGTNTSIIKDNASVIFKLNDITLKDDNGNIVYVPIINNTATYNYSVGVLSSVNKDNTLRNYNVTAVYYNPNFYPTNNRNTTQFNVEKSLINININQIAVKDASLKIKANMTDYLDYNIKGTNKICIKINGITYKENNLAKYFIIQDGIIDIDNIDIGNNIVKNVEIVTGERQSYYSSRITTSNIIVE